MDNFRLCGLSVSKAEKLNDVHKAFFAFVILKVQQTSSRVLKVDEVLGKNTASLLAQIRSESNRWEHSWKVFMVFLIFSDCLCESFPQNHQIFADHLTSFYPITPFHADLLGFQIFQVLSCFVWVTM